TPGRIRWFKKEVFEVRGPERLAVVRKRRAEGATLAPVLLVHGFGQNRYAWHMPERSFANYLADCGFDVFNVDLRGHGRSAELGRGHFVLGTGLRALHHTLGAVGMFRGSQRKFPVDLIGKALHAARFAFDSRFAPIPVRGWHPGSFDEGELASYVRSFDAESF